MLSRRQPSAPPSTSKTQITRRDITLPSPPAATDTTIAALARPPSLSEIGKSNQTRALNPHSPTPPLAQTPPRFPPSRLFGRLPPSPSSRPCPAGVRKPLTIPVVCGIATSPAVRPFADIRAGVLRGSVVERRRRSTAKLHRASIVTNPGGHPGAADDFHPDGAERPA